MRLTAVVVSILLVQGAVLAAATGLASMDVSGATVSMGMSEAEVRAALPEGIALHPARDLLPPVLPRNVRVSERQGETWYLAAKDSPRAPLAWLTFEGGTLTQATKLVGEAEEGGAHAAMELLASAIHDAFSGEDTPVDLSTGIYDTDGQSFVYLAAAAGAKRVVVRSLPRSLQVSEEIGREDIPAADWEMHPAPR